MAEHTLLQAPTSDPTYQVNRRKRRNDIVPIPHKWFEVLSMHLAGKKRDEILEETGYSIGTYYRIMQNPRVIAVRQQLLKMYQDDFEALFSKVINNLHKQLDSEDMKTAQTAQAQWLRTAKEHKIVSTRLKEEDSAEDLVANMLNIQVNVNAQGAEGSKTETINTINDEEDRLPIELTGGLSDSTLE